MATIFALFFLIPCIVIAFGLKAAAKSPGLKSEAVKTVGSMVIDGLLKRRR